MEWLRLSKKPITANQKYNVTESKIVRRIQSQQVAYREITKLIVRYQSERDQVEGQQY